MRGPWGEGNGTGDVTSSGNVVTAPGREGGWGLASTGRQSSATEEDDTVLPIAVWGPALPVSISFSLSSP